MKKYNSIFFDLDDTILDYTHDEIASFLKVLENHELPCDNDVVDLYYENNERPIFELGKEITAYDIISNRFGLLLDCLQIKGELKEQLRHEFFELMRKAHKVKKGAIKTLRYLKEKGYTLYITTNGYPEFQRKRIKSSRISKYFTRFYISEEIGHTKPSPAFFDYIMKRIPESSRSKVLIVGDAATADILGGINAKIDTCFLSNNGKKCTFRYTYKINKITDLINML